MYSHLSSPPPQTLYPPPAAQDSDPAPKPRHTHLHPHSDTHLHGHCHGHSHLFVLRHGCGGNSRSGCRAVLLRLALEAEGLGDLYLWPQERGGEGARGQGVSKAGPGTDTCTSTRQPCLTYTPSKQSSPHLHSPGVCGPVVQEGDQVLNQLLGTHKAGSAQAMAGGKA